MLVIYKEKSEVCPLRPFQKNHLTMKKKHKAVLQHPLFCFDNAKVESYFGFAKFLLVFFHFLKNLI